MSGQFSRRVSRRRRRVFVVGGPEQLETRQLLTELSGTVFHDTNDDGTFDSNEVGIAGVLVTLTGTTDEGDQVTRRFLTHADGSYVFDNVEPGTYEITESQPASISDGQDSTDASGVTTGDDRYSNIELTDQAIAGLNFGEGLIDPAHLSPLWLLASSAREDVARDIRADFEDMAGNADIAEAIRGGDDEIGNDININVRPTADNDSYTLAEGVAELEVGAEDGVLGNDSDPEGSELTAVLVDEPENGTVTLGSDGSFTYVPDTGFSGTDTFTYTSNDGFKNSTPATVSISVADRNTFSVSESALENESVGTVQASEDLGEDVVYDFFDSSVNETFRLNADDHFSGLAEAPVVVIEYLDFACPACRSFHQGSVATELRQAPGDYLVVYRYNPLDTFNANHNIEAARAAEAASRQGLFIEMMGQLFDNFDEWRAAADADAAIALFEGYGSSIGGFDLAQFRSDFADPDVLDRIERDRDEARAQNILATPTFILEGERLDSNPTITQLRQAINAAEDAPFKINHYTTGSATAGELLIFNGDAVTEDDSPFTVQVEARGTDGSEIIDVTVNVTP